MTIISAAYILLFLPLLSSLLCQISPKKNIAYLISVISVLFLIFLSLGLFKKIWILQNVENNFALFPLSLALEFKINSISMMFFIVIILLKIFTLFYYQQDIKNFLNEKNSRIFYAVFCLKIFAIAGILTSNNFLNFFLFLEIYSISFLAFFSISRDKKIAKISFSYFFCNAAASLILLFCFLIIYINFTSLNFDFVKENLLKSENSILFKTLSLLIFFCIIVKFFPFWIYFENLKNTNLFANFFAIDTLFIKANLGLFVIFKFYYLFFGKISISLILIFLAIILSFYSAFRIFQSKHFKIIVINFCLNNFAFILICLVLKNEQALKAVFFYWLNFNLIAFFLFIFATFLKRKFATSLIDRIAILTESKQFYGNNFLLLPLKLILIFIAAFPFTFLFYANFNLSLASLEFAALLQYHFAIFISPFIITSLIISQFSLFIFACKIMLLSFEKNDRKITAKRYEYWFHVISFLAIILVIYVLIINAGFLNELSIKFAQYE